MDSEMETDQEAEWECVMCQKLIKETETMGVGSEGEWGEGGWRDYSLPF